MYCQTQGLGEFEHDINYTEINVMRMNVKETVASNVQGLNKNTILQKI